MAKRRTLYFTDDQWDRIQAVSKEMGESASTIVRLAVDDYYLKFRRRESLTSPPIKREWKSPSLDSYSSLLKRKSKKK